MTFNQPTLTVVAGLPGTGKTTLAGPLSRRLGACYLRVDAIETAIARIRGPVSGPEGYAVAAEVARSNLLIGLSVVVDAVCPVAESRTVWVQLAAEVSARLVMFETQLADRAEHERRVTGRRPDLVGHQLPDWDAVQNLGYQAWDPSTEGHRVRVNTSDTRAALATALATLTASQH